MLFLCFVFGESATYYYSGNPVEVTLGKKMEKYHFE